MNVDNDLNLVEDNTDINNSIIGTTKGGKQVSVFTASNGLWRAKFTTGGELPKSLKGSFTKYDLAVSAVKAYLAAEPEPLSKLAQQVLERKLTRQAAKKRSVNKESSKDAKSSTKSKSE